MPEIVSRLVDLANDDASVQELARILRMDPSLTVRTLQIANNAWYKRSRQISELNEAIAMIGVKSIYQLIFSTCVSRIFTDVPGDLVDMDKFWRQSYLMASYAQAVANKVDRSLAQPCFTAGIMTYLGKLLVYTSEPELSRKILSTVKQKQLPQFQVENFFLSFNHADICAAMLQYWQLPSSLYLPIKYYHRPDHTVVKDDRCSSILHLAHYMQYTYASDIGVTDPPSAINAHALKRLGINETELSPLAASAQDNYLTAVAVLQL